MYIYIRYSTVVTVAGEASLLLVYIEVLVCIYRVTDRRSLYCYVHVYIYIYYEVTICRLV